jgi:DHA2 family metal-tetracycline-proton antiporter-like MFS transporter
MILGFVILGLFPDQNIVINLIAMILIFMAYSSIQVALNNFIPKMLNPIKIGVGLGLYNLTNFVGMAFGPALASKIIEVTNNLSYVFLLMAIFLVGHFLLTFHFPVSQNKD